MPGHFHLSGRKLRTVLNAEPTAFLCQGETGSLKLFFIFRSKTDLRANFAGILHAGVPPAHQGMKKGPRALVRHPRLDRGSRVLFFVCEKKDTGFPIKDVGNDGFEVLRLFSYQ